MCRKIKAVREFRVEGFTDWERLSVLPPNGFILVVLLLLLFFWGKKYVNHGDQSRSEIHFESLYSKEAHPEWNSYCDVETLFSVLFPILQKSACRPSSADLHSDLQSWVNKIFCSSLYIIVSKNSTYPEICRDCNVATEISQFYRFFYFKMSVWTEEPKKKSLLCFVNCYF